MRSSAALALAVAVALFAQIPTAPFRAASPGYRYEFPRDYFSHPEYQTEWWYYTGNLRDADGRRFGFELTFFRRGVNREPVGRSAWEIRDVYLAHFAVSDLGGKRFFHTERTNRAGPGIAGASERLARIWNGNWSVSRLGAKQELAALAGTFGLALALMPEKEPVIHGENGVSRKSAGAGRASHYFSETRLRASGTIRIETRAYAVSGLAWADHEFFTRQLEADQVGWDWLCAQLENHTELMLFQIRRNDGSVDPFSAGTFVDAQGRPRHLRRADFELVPSGETWTSPLTGAKYPTRWKVRVPSFGLQLEASTPLPSQEIAGDANIAPNYWEGAVELKSRSGAGGWGYLEMTGYERSLDMGKM
jgi:predicted secreted hydrolase